MANTNKEQRTYLPKKVIEGCRLTFKNFAGKRGVYNEKGSRTFAIQLDHELAKELESEGYTIKWPEDEQYLPTLEVTVSREHDYIHPSVKLYLVDGERLTRVGNDDFRTIERLDKMSFGSVDVVIAPYEWEMQGRRGLKAYLASAYFNLGGGYGEDPLAAKYGLTDDDMPLPFD